MAGRISVQWKPKWTEQWFNVCSVSSVIRCVQILLLVYTSEVVLETQVLVSKILRGSARNPTLGLHAIPLETAVRTWDWLQAESRLWRPDSHRQWRNQSRRMEANHAQGGATHITSGNTRDWREGNTYYIQLCLWHALYQCFVCCWNFKPGQRHVPTVTQFLQDHLAANIMFTLFSPPSLLKMLNYILSRGAPSKFLRGDGNYHKLPPKARSDSYWKLQNDGASGFKVQTRSVSWPETLTLALTLNLALTLVHKAPWCLSFRYLPWP